MLRRMRTKRCWRIRKQVFQEQKISDMLNRSQELLLYSLERQKITYKNFNNKKNTCKKHEEEEGKES